MSTNTFFCLFFVLLDVISTSTIRPEQFCKEKHDYQTLICHKRLPTWQQNEENPRKSIKSLELHNIDWEIVDMSVLSERFPNIENVSIQNGNLRKFITPTQNMHIKVLKLNNMRIESISSRFLNHFPNLETLNLQRNDLQSLKQNFFLGSVRNLYLAENKWNCSLDLDWILNLDQTIIKDFDNMTCYGEPHAGKHILTIANFMKNIKAECPEICSCKLYKIVKIPHLEKFEPMIEVNCSYRNLQTLPETIPLGTKILKVEGNEIEDLQPLKTNRLYRSLLEIYLDNNEVKTIEDLEGSYWLKHFRVFSLTGNKLTELPTYALDNALEQNGNMPDAVRINLGGNPWRCDCVFTPVFQEMLQKFAPQIRDMREVKCSYVEGDENSLLPIIELSRSSVCRLPTEYSVKALNLLNGVLASLIIFILGKLAYDYYYFKKTGRLPWIVTKMP